MDQSYQAWHQRGYQGQGVIIDVLEASATDSHGRGVIHVIRQIAPRSIITQKPYNLVSLQESKANLINISLDIGGYRYRPQYEADAVNRGISLIIAAGNQGKGKLSPNAKSSQGIIVGAVHYQPQYRRFVRPRYSAYDEGFPHVVAPSKEFMLGEKELVGTSYSAAAVTGMLACWFQWFYQQWGHYPTPAETQSFVFNYASPLPDIGTGAGVFLLPAPELFLE